MSCGRLSKQNARFVCFLGVGPPGVVLVPLRDGQGSSWGRRGQGAGTQHTLVERVRVHALAVVVGDDEPGSWSARWLSGFCRGTRGAGSHWCIGTRACSVSLPRKQHKAGLL